MKYTISQISKLTGLSPSGIRFYERTGVISPMRGENGKYRDFSMHELQLLLNCKQYRECGFSMKESLDLVYNPDILDVKEQLKLQSEKLEKQIVHQQFIMELLREKACDFSYLLTRSPSCELVELLPLYWFPIVLPGDSGENTMPHEEALRWLDLEPLTSSILVISRDDFLFGKERIEPEKGITIDERVVKGLGLKTEPWGIYIPGGMSVRTIVRVNEDLSINSAELELARQFLMENTLSIDGPIFSRTFHITNNNGILERTDQLWVPVSNNP